MTDDRRDVPGPGTWAMWMRGGVLASAGGGPLNVLEAASEVSMRCWCRLTSVDHDEMVWCA